MMWVAFRAIPHSAARPSSSNMSFSSRATFESSLQPMVILMKIIGLPLDFGSSSAGLIFALLTISLLFLGINLTANCYLVANAIARNDFLFPFAGFYLSLFWSILKCVVNLVLVSGVPVIFIAHLVTGRWLSVWNSLIRIQDEMKLTREFYRSCFNICLAAISLLCLVIIDRSFL